MKVLADENCEREMIDALRDAGHDVITILDLSPSMDDAKVFNLARSEGRILVTNDRDFGLIAERADLRPPAVVLMRLERLSLPGRIEIVLRALAGLGQSIDNQFIVIEPHEVRTRTYAP
jgi:predicted nuclease of predicted toxin-antitoxin system